MLARASPFEEATAIGDAPPTRAANATAPTNTPRASRENGSPAQPEPDVSSAAAAEAIEGGAESRPGQWSAARYMPAPPPVAVASFEQAIQAAPDEEADLQTNWLDASSGFVASAVVHIVLLILLAFISLTTAGDAVLGLVVSSRDVPVPLEEMVELDLDRTLESVDLRAASSSALNDLATLAASNQAADADAVAVDAPDLQIAAAANFGIRLPSDDVLKTKLIEDGGAGSIIGQVREPLRASTSAQDAIDGIASEVLDGLGQRDLLVVWAFDASISMRQDRREAARRLAPIFREIHQRARNNPRRFRNAVLAFGRGSKQLRAPARGDKPLNLNADLNVVRAINRLTEDPSGDEYVMTMIQEATKEYRKQWTGRILFVIWTDEAGNDVERLEETIEFCKANDVAVSVVGASATLGKRGGYQYFEDSRLKIGWYLPVAKGPESALPQRMLIPHWRGYGANFLRSGFGPYALVRLARATGGSFTVYNRPGDSSRFDFELLRPYLPDYRSAASVEKEAQSRPLRRALIAAARITERVQPEVSRRRAANQQSSGDPAAPRLADNFRYWYPPGEYQAKFRSLMGGEQAYVRHLADSIEPALRELDNPRIEEQYSSEPPRWQAGYDLALGRLLMMSVRCREYDLALQEAFGGLRGNINRCWLRHSSKLRSGDGGQKRVERAKEYLQRCISLHAGTPWAVLAKYELATSPGFSTSWRYVPPPPPAPAGPVAPAGPAPTPPNL